jgi:hypothetical protein
MTLKQTRLATTDAAKLSRSGSGPLAGAPSLRDFAGTSLDVLSLATIL